MPIQLPFPFRNLSPAEFDQIDAVVMPCAYAAQNILGRLYEPSSGSTSTTELFG
jgi:hypothetical protein